MGLATAPAFAEAGKLKAAGHRVIAVSYDVGDDSQVEAMVARTVDEFGRLDAAFNNAGVMVNNASVGALTGNPGIGSYIASKHGVGA